MGARAIAATVVWKNNSSEFTTGSNWETGAAPTGSDIASFPSGTVVNPYLSGNHSVAGISFESTAGAYTFSGSGTAVLTLGSSGISQQGGTGQTLAASLLLSLGANSVFTTTSTGALTIGSAIDNSGSLLTLTSSSTGTGSISGIISGSGGLTKTGTNTWTLSGANTFSGNTTLTAGTLVAGNDSAFGSGTLSLNSGTLTADAARTLANAIALNANSIIGGSQDITLDGKLTNTGGNRTLTLSNTGSTTLADIDLSNNSTNRTLTLNNAGTVEVTGVIADGGGSTASGLTKTGAGTLTLSGTNTYSGPTALSAGTLVAGSDRAFGTGNLTISTGATLAGSGTRSLSNNITLAGSATIGGSASLSFNGALTQSATTTLSISNSGGTTFSNVNLSNSASNRTLTFNTTGASVVVSGEIANGGGSTGSGLTKTGSGSLTLAGANSYGGITTLTAGILRVTDASGLGTSTTANALALNGGTLQLANNASTDFARNTTLGGSAAITIDRVSGSGSVIHSLGNLVSSATSTLTVQPGSNLDAGTAYGLNFGAVTLNGTLLTINVANNGAGTGTVTLGALTNSAARGITKTGAGNLVLGAAAGSLFSGTPLVINNGNVTLGADNALGGSALVPVTINNTAGTTSTFSLGGFNQTITTLTFGGTNSTATSVNNVETGGGTLTLGGNVTYNATNNPRSATLSGKVDLGTGNRTFTVNASSNADTELTVTANISGTGVGLTKAGGGVMELSGNNTYDGATTLSAGTLRATSQTGALGAGNLIITGGILQLANDSALAFNRNTTLSTASSTITSDRLTSGDGVTHTLGTLAITTNGLTLTANAGANATSGAGLTFGATTLAATTPTFNVGTNTTLTLGALSDNGTARSVTKSGAGTLVLSESATSWNSGSNLTITNGTVRLDAADALGGSALTNIVVNATTAGATARFELNGVNQAITGLTFGGTGATGNSTNVVATGVGTLTVGGNVTYSATNNPLGATLSGKVDLGGTTRTFTIGDSANAAIDLTVSADVSGTGAGLIKAGTGSLLLSGSNSYSGNTTISAGTLIAGSNTALGTGTLVLSGGTLKGDGTARTFANAVLANASSTLGGSSDLSFAGTLTQNNTSTTLTISNSGTTTFSAIDLTNNVTSRTLTLNSTGGDVVVTGVIANGGSSTASALTKSGAGNLTLFGSNTYGGATTVNAGTLRLGASDAIPNTSAVTVSGLGTGVIATLDLNGYSDTISTLTFGGSTASSGAVVTTGGGVLTLGTTLTYSATNNPLGATLNGNLNLGTSTHTFAINDSTNVNASADLTITANITGAGGGFTKTGTGTLVLSGTNSQTGTTTISAGNVTVDSGATLSAATAPLTVNAGVLNLNNAAQTLGALSSTLATGTINLGLGHTLTVSQATSTSYSGAIAGEGSLVKDGSGTLTLSGANTYTGTTTVAAGTLSLARTGGSPALTSSLIAIGNGTGTTTVSLAAANQMVSTAAVTLNDSGGTPTLSLNGYSQTLGSIASANTASVIALGSPVAAATFTVGDASDTSFAGAISGGANAAFAKAGSGTLTLSGANTFAGNVTVAGGVLSVQHNSGLGSTAGNTTVNSGAAVHFSNVAHGNLTIAAEPLFLNGTGVAADGALRNVAGNNSLAGAVTLSSDARINSDANLLTLSGGVSSTNRALTVGGTGNTTISGNLNLGTGSLTKDGAGTLSLTGSTHTVGSVALSAGTLSVGGGSTLHSADLSAQPGVTLDIAAGGKVVADYASGTTTFAGALAGAGEFAKTGAGILVFDHTFTAPNLTLTLSGGTLSLTGGAHLTVGTLHITGDLILDFNNSANTFISSAALIIDGGVTVTVRNWISVADNAAASTIWSVTNTINGVPLGLTDQSGGTPLNQIVFAGYSGLTPTWVSGNHNGWFNHEIRPTPEPGTYGVVFSGACLALVWWRRRRAAPA